MSTGTIYLQHAETGQLAKLNGGKLAVIRLKDCGFIMPGTTSKVYEVVIIEKISPEYLHALCMANVSLAKREWERKLTELIHTLIA